MIRKVYILKVSLKGLFGLYKRILDFRHGILHLVVLYCQAFFLIYYGLDVSQHIGWEVLF
jgi:hypothetical protein